VVTLFPGKFRKVFF